MGIGGGGGAQKVPGWGLQLREHLKEKKSISFGHGGGSALPEFVYPFFHHVVPYILTSISCYVILFGHF